jgi:TPR repeat protein
MEMNRHIGSAVAILAILALSEGCMPQNRTNTPGVAINDSLAFRSSMERRQAERRALAGDEAAALRLGEYSFLVDEDLRAAKYWYRLAASHASQTGKENLASLNRIDPKEWAAAHRKAKKD